MATPTQIDFSDFKKLEKVVLKPRKVLGQVENRILKSLFSIIAVHKKFYSQGKDFAGKKQKAYSPSYKQAIRDGEVRGRRVRKRRPNLSNLKITGDFLKSMQIKKIGGGKVGAQAFFPPSSHYSGLSMNELGQELRKKRFKFHEFSKADERKIDEMRDQIGEEIIKQLLT